MSGSPRSLAILIALLALFASAALSLAPSAAVAAPFHPAVSTVAIVHLTPDARVEIRLLHDTLAFALKDTSAQVSDAQMYTLLRGPPDALASALADAHKRLSQGIQLRVIDASGKPGPPLAYSSVETATLASIETWKSEHPDQRLPVRIDAVLKTTLPPGAAAVTLQFPETLGDVVILVDRPELEPVNMPLQPGETSPAIDVRLARDAKSPTPPDASSSTTPPRGTPAATPPAPRTSTDQIGFWGVSVRYIKLGFNHIIPEGTDHCLFVLGLFLLSPRVKPVLWQITAFTCAHTLTLTLTALHLVSVSPRIVEPAIAASIAFVGVENLLVNRVHSWRYAVAFLFGLIHGMGVASSFTEAGFPAGQLVTSLAAFTLGVESGHLSVLAVAFLLLAWTRDKPWYRPRVAIPFSILIGLIAFFWLAQRLAAGTT